MVGWLIANPPGAGPDEPAHYVKAIATGRGELFGQPAEQPAVRGTFFTTTERRWMAEATRRFHVPERLQASGRSWGCRLAVQQAVPCDTATPPQAATTTYVGTYQPAAYVPSGLAARFGWSMHSALALERVAQAGTCLVLVSLGMAVVVSRDGASGRLLGALLALTPTTLFLFASVNPTAIECAAAFAFAIALTALDESPDETPRAAWPGLVIGGGCLALARSTGPVFLAVLVVAVIGVGRGVRLLRSRPAATAAIIAAAALGLAWERAVQPSPSAPTLSALWATRSELTRVLTQQVGVFGWLDLAVPPAFVAVWLLGLSILVIAGLRARLAATLRLLAVVATTTGALMAVYEVSSGFAFQGRYALPLTMAVPLTVGATWRPRDDRAARFAGLGATVVAVLQAVALAMYANDSAVRWGYRPARYAIVPGLIGASLLVFAARRVVDEDLDRVVRAPGVNV